MNLQLYNVAPNVPEELKQAFTTNCFISGATIGLPEYAEISQPSVEPTPEPTPSVEPTLEPTPSVEPTIEPSATPEPTREPVQAATADDVVETTKVFVNENEVSINIIKSRLCFLMLNKLIAMIGNLTK